MFLQEIINKKLSDPDDLDMDDEYAQYEQSATQKTMRKTNLIGSIRNGCVNYPKDQKFFHSSDVPGKAKEANSAMKNLTDKDVFKLKRPEWNPSVSKAGLPSDDNDEINLFSIRKGMQDFQPLPTKEKKVYEGCDSREQHHTGWNVSNQVPIPLDQQKMIAEETIMRMTKTKEANEKMLGAYKSPYERAKEHSTMLSTQREQIKEMKETFRDHPNAEKIIKNKFFGNPRQDEFKDKNETFKPDLSKSKGFKSKKKYRRPQWDQI